MTVKELISEYNGIIEEKESLIKIHKQSLKKGNMKAKYPKIKAEYAISIFEKVIEDLKNIK